MKKLIIILTICMPATLLYTFVLFNVYTKQQNAKLKIDLPEEYPLTSQNSHSPDTLIAFWRNDTLCLRFVVAARNYPQFNH